MAIREKYNHKIADGKKARRHKEAEVRQKLRDSRSDTEQLTRLTNRNHQAIKERSRLNG